MKNEVRMSFLNLLRTALRGALANKLRAALTTLGIVIGVASVIAMLALGTGARAAVESAFRSLGADEVQIFEKKVFENGEFKSIGQQLTHEHGVNMPYEVEQVDRVDMTVSGAGRVRYQRSTLDMNYTGVTADALRSIIAAGEVQPRHLPSGQALTPESFLLEGRFFSPAEVLQGADVCVLGYDTAQDLFEGDNALGETIWVNRRPCQVIGVLAELEPTDPQQRYRENRNEALILPISKVIVELYETPPSVYINAYVKDELNIEQAKEEIRAYLRQRHQVEKDEEGAYQDDFEMTTRSDILGAQQEAARTFSLLLTAMAAVSLAVGGIGIMNVMLVSVTERTREIGIRLAVGAQQRDIIIQFLLEAVLISAGGGLLGVVLGIFTIPLAAQLNQGMAVLAPDSIPLAFGVALLTGVVFGLYPAVRAARFSPMEALHYE
jgi:ABC-type antimicrobial peptide transport system permease subunit